MRPLRYSFNVTLPLELLDRKDYRSGAVALRYRPERGRACRVGRAASGRLRLRRQNHRA